MEPNQAAEHLQTIRTLMERSAVYRRALAPIMIYCGVVGISGMIGNWLPLETGSESPSFWAGAFVLFWTTVAMAALSGSFLLARRQAIKDSEPFWSPPTKRIMQALAPPFIIGAFCGLVAVWAGAPGFPDLLIPCWCFLFGLAIYSAGFFMPRGLKLFGWLFIFTGFLLLTVQILSLESLKPAFEQPYLLMGGIFGGLHLAYGIYLYFTEKRGNES